MTRTLLMTGAAALAIAAVVTPVVMLAMRRLGVVDLPDGLRKLHGRAVPLGGGVAIGLAILITIGGGRSVVGSWLPLLVAGCLLCLVGLADDAWDLRGRHKLIGQVAAVSVLMAGGMVIRGVSLFGWELELGVLSIPFTLLWLLGTVNAINLLDGIDGLAAIVGAMIGCALAGLAVLNGRTDEAAIASALAGATLGFLVYNFPPARAFLGDSGSTLIGLVLGAIAIRASSREPGTIALAAPVAIWTLPFLDLSMAIVRRKLTGYSIYVPDRAHVHHRIRERGFGPRGSLLLLASLCAATTAGALASVVLEREWVALAVAVAVVASLAVTRLFGHSEVTLLARRAKAVAQRLLSLPRSVASEHRSRIQGTLEWDQLWEPLVSLAEASRFDHLELSVHVPSAHEQFFAAWGRDAGLATGRLYQANLPLTSARFGSVGTLRITGHCPEGSACTWIGELSRRLVPFETQLDELLASQFDPPRNGSSARSGLARAELLLEP